MPYSWQSAIYNLQMDIKEQESSALLEAVGAINWSSLEISSFYLSLSCCSVLAGNQEYKRFYHWFAYIIKIWAVWMACIWKIAFCLQHSGTKYQLAMFYLGQMVHHSAHCDGPLCKPHWALISFTWCPATKWTQETKRNILNHQDFPLHMLSFACQWSLISSPSTGSYILFSSESSLNCLNLLFQVCHDPWLHNLGQPVVLQCFHFCMRVHSRPMLTTCCARSSCWSLNILTVH